MSEARKYTKKDFTSDRAVKWCPGCGDYAILAAVQKTMADLGRPLEKQVVISGIGCSSRFPIYMNTHGFHTIHGRAPSVATGVRVANPDLDVWIVTGDGDGLSIGGNHLMHAIRRNIDAVVLLFNNRIYGLTKGQYSPTSEQNKVTKSTPYGSPDTPVNPLAFALSSGAGFVARTYDINPKHMQATFKAAREYKGLAFVEIYQNCVIFNDGAFADVTDRTVRHDKLLDLQAGEPLTFGKEGEKCLVMNGFQAEVKLTSEVSEDQILKHDSNDNPLYQQMLAQLDAPRPIGVLRSVERAVYEDIVHDQVDTAKEKFPNAGLADLLKGGAHWDVEGEAADVEQFTAFKA